jgi:hypothetical protein
VAGPGQYADIHKQSNFVICAGYFTRIVRIPHLFSFVTVTLIGTQTHARTRTNTDGVGNLSTGTKMPPKSLGVKRYGNGVMWTVR